jgi:hypothetical protein
MWNVTLHAYVCVCLYIKMVYVFNKINWKINKLNKSCYAN